MHGNRAWDELRGAHGSTGRPSIPATIKCRVGQGESGRKNGGGIVQIDRNPVVPTFSGGRAQPLVAFAVGAFGNAPPVDISPAVETGSFGQEGVINHATHGVGGRGIEPCDKKESVGHRGIEDGRKASEVGVLEDAEILVVECPEHGELGIHRSLIVATDRIPGIGAGGRSGVRNRRWDCRDNL